MSAKNLYLEYKVSKQGQRYIKVENAPEEGVLLKNDDILYVTPTDEFFNGLAEAGVISQEKADKRISETPSFVKGKVQIAKTIIARTLGF